MASKEYKFFTKDQKKYKKQVKKLLKESGPWEWSFMDDAIKLMLKRRLEYFEKGYNVWQVDESRLETVDELKECLRLFEHAEKDFEPTDVLDVKFVEDTELGGTTMKFIKKDGTEETEEEKRARFEKYEQFAEHRQGWWD